MFTNFTTVTQGKNKMAAVIESSPVQAGAVKEPWQWNFI